VAKPAVWIAVLAGGLGSRLGGQKPATMLAGRPLISHAVALAATTGLPVVIVAKQDSPLPELDARMVLEPDEPRHPLAGVLAALQAMPGRDPDSAVLALGCDMPFLTAPLLLRLAAAEGAAALRVDGRLQPLPARYPLSALDRLQRSLDAQRPMREALSALSPLILDEADVKPYGDPRRLCFSVNDAAELRLAETWLAEQH
jgi:molybdopterin-guanine dinucleotide biosynthesis protein A